MLFHWILTLGHLIPPVVDQLQKIIGIWLSRQNAGNGFSFFLSLFSPNPVKIEYLNKSNTPQTLFEPLFAQDLGIYPIYVFDVPAFCSAGTCGNMCFFLWTTTLFWRCFDYVRSIRLRMIHWPPFAALTYVIRAVHLTSIISFCRDTFLHN